MRQNDRLVTVLRVTEPQARYARVLLVDRLPAGLEIDNPKLVDSGSVEALDWLKTDVEPASVEYRDDRFVAAFDRTVEQPAFFTVAYIVRAVAPGRYVHPPAHVEDMYRPERFGRTAFGSIDVVARRMRAREPCVLAGVSFERRLIPVVLVGTAASPCGATSKVSARSILSVAEKRSTIVDDRDGRLLRPFATDDGRWRLPVAAADVDARFLAMLKAYEDARFERHVGVDALALARAGGQLLRHGRIVSGGSTITMQVARLIEPREERTIAAKLRQIIRAFQLERRFTKSEILALLRDPCPLWRQSRGNPSRGTVLFRPRAEASVLGGGGASCRPAAIAGTAPPRPLPRGGASRPQSCPRPCGGGRRPLAEEAEAAKAEPVPMGRQPFPMLAAHAAEAAVAEEPERRVHRLSIEGRLQESLEALVRERVERFGPQVSGAVFVIDNATGEVRAHVGSGGYLTRERAGAIDMTQALRSPGSALKPFIYALAFESGLAHPETLLDDRPSRLRRLSARKLRPRHSRAPSRRGGRCRCPSTCQPSNSWRTSACRASSPA